MENKFNLKSAEVLNKKFKTEISGYSAKQVDEYLDLILEDYRNYEELIELKNQQIEDRDESLSSKEEEIQALDIEIKNVRSILKKVGNSTSSAVTRQIMELKSEIDKLKNK